MTTERETELAALIAEQEKDDQWGHRVRSASLDAQIGGDDEAGTYYELHGQVDEQLVTLMGGEETSLRKITPPQKWTRRQVISAIRKWAKEHGKPPTHRDWTPVNGRGFPSTNAVKSRFGSWSAAIAAAGFQPYGRGGVTHPIQHTRLRPRLRKQRHTAYLTPEQVAAAYVIYDRQKLSMPQLAELLFREYGFRTAASCRNSLLRSFHSDGYPVRTRGEGVSLRWTDERRRQQADRIRQRHRRAA